MDKKTVIQINVEVPHVVNTLLDQSKKFLDGGMELLRFGMKRVMANTETSTEKKQLKKIEIK